MQIKIKRLNPKAILPKYAMQGDAGMDLFAAESIVIEPEGRHAVATGLAIELPEGFVSLVWDKSGLALNKGITTMGGVIEHTYRGEYKIILLNTTDQPYEIKIGDKIAQLLIQPVVTAEIVEADELSETARGTGGFGSTGIK
ncbi:MAG: dUTP diphosphatase [Candidatus Berkelbacteria bacterium]|nr:dUTP diphosphatase [Candidatus Berkelbacteria bacterium]